MHRITISIGPGELLDRFSILSIKLSFAVAADVRNAISQQMAHLADQRRLLDESPELDRLEQELAQVNRRLWDVEDALRALEAADNFGREFVELARRVYQLNDRRASLRSHIDAICESNITDYKFYSRSGQTEEAL